MYTVKDLVDLAEQTCALAKQFGADEAEAQLAAGAELAVKVRLGEIEHLHEAASKALGLRILKGKRAALTYTSELHRDALERFVRESVALADLAEPDELNFLPDKDELARELPDLDLWDDETLGITAAHAIDQCRRAEAAARGFSDKVTNSDGASFSRTVGAGAFANTQGFSGGVRGTYQSLVVEPICDDAGGKKRNGFHWTGARFRSALEDPEAVGREAARRTVAKLGAEKIETGKLPVVFDPDAARALLRTLVGVISGGSIYRKSSYLVDREGTVIASPLVHIADDPLIKRGPGSRPFDGEGLPSRTNVIVEGGVLKTYLLDCYSARKLGRRSNGCAGRGVGGGPHVTTSNFILQKGASTPAEVRNVPRGLYVTDMMGFGFNSVTGDFSRGAAGFLIENGELTRPVGEITISANFDDLLKNIDAVGDDLDLRTSTACPTLRVREMMIAGK